MLDHRWRLQERKLDRLAAIRVRTPRGRRRKNYISEIETARYRELIIAVARDLRNRNARTTESRAI